jgi:hypothetical protein
MITERQHYIIQNGILLPVSEISWRIWTEDNSQKLKVRETHLIRRGTPDIWGKVLTHFTGIDICPGSDKPYLWQTKLFDAAKFEVQRHASEQQARERHDRYVFQIVWWMQKENIWLDAVEIDLSKITQETT